MIGWASFIFGTVFDPCFVGGIGFYFYIVVASNGSGSVSAAGRARLLFTLGDDGWRQHHETLPNGVMGDCADVLVRVCGGGGGVTRCVLKNSSTILGYFNVCPS